MSQDSTRIVGAWRMVSRQFNDWDSDGCGNVRVSKVDLLFANGVATHPVTGEDVTYTFKGYEYPGAEIVIGGSIYRYGTSVTADTLVLDRSGSDLSRDTYVRKTE